MDYHYSIVVGTDSGEDPYEIKDSYGFYVGKVDSRYHDEEVTDELILEELRVLIRKKKIKLEILWKDGLCRCAG